MKLLEVIRFELGYQVRRAWFWLMFAAILVVSFMVTRDGSLDEALRDDFFVNSPFSLAKVTVVGGLLWIVVAGAVAGEAAARDRATGMHPLTYTTPVGKSAYLGGRFLAALALNALLLLGVPAGALVAIHASGMDPASMGPFRPAAYLTNYAFLALPNAFFATAIQFWLAVRSGRPMAAYLGSFLLIFMGFFIASMVLFNSGTGRLLDPVGVRFVLDEMSHLWTSYEKSWRLVTLKGVVLGNRLLWIGVGAAALALSWMGFAFAHPPEGAPRWRRTRPQTEHPPVPTGSGLASAPSISVPRVPRSFGPAVQVRKALAMAWTSFRTTAGSWAGFGILTFVPLLSLLVVADQMDAGGARLLPNTVLVLRELTGPLSDELSRWIFVPFLIVYFAGELVWHERDAGMGEMIDATPGSAWAPLVGTFLGLAFLLVLFMALIMGAGMAAQALMGYPEFDAALYVKALFGLQLAEYLLFVPLALAVHVLVDHKYVGHVVAMMIYVVIVLAPMFGIEHKLLVYGSSPGWSYTYLRGFGPSLGPWLWFKLYWAAWAVLLMVMARLLWVRGMESGLRVRLPNARRRLRGATLALAGMGLALVLAVGGFVFYNTNVLNEYRSSAAVAELQAEYERRYGRFRDVPQPYLTAAELHLDIDPERREVRVRGSYRLVNGTGLAIDSLHLAPVPGVETAAVTLDRPATLLPTRGDLPHQIHALAEPLEPGDSMRVDFQVRVAPQGFGESGTDPSLAEEASAFDIRSWLPGIGYQPGRELTGATERREHGLSPRPLVPTLADAEVRRDRGPGVALDVVVETAADQVAVAPGSLRRTWSEGGRRSFHFVTDGPIGSEWTVASADYAGLEARWEDRTGEHEAVDIRIYHHPGHTQKLESMVRGIRASLDTYTRAFGPYPYRHLTFLEIPAPGMGMHAAASMITFTEGTTFISPVPDDETMDFHLAIVAHEMGHQWTVPSAFVEGAPVLSESLAWYYAMRVLEEQDPDHLRQLLEFLHQPYPYPQIRRGEPLLRGVDPYMAYRRGPFALHALSEYLGDEPVDRALRTLLEKHDAAGAPLATTLDLYRELQAVTPDSLDYLLHDLFEVNTFWELKSEWATAEPAGGDAWEVTLDVQARKVVADSTGTEAEVPLAEWIEIGVFGRPSRPQDELSSPLYLGRHRIHTGQQTVKVTVPERPFLAGVDPHHVLDWVANEDDDNIVGVEIRDGS